MRKLFLSLAFLAVVAVPMSAATDGGYSSDHIRAAALRLNVSADSLAVGDTRMKVKGSTILVRKIDNGDIDFIGIPLFNPAMRRDQSLPIYDFLEYACLDRKFGISSNRLLYKDVTFVKGDWNVLLQLGDSADCSVRSVNDRMYEVQWSRGGKVMADVKVPIRYDVLSLSSRGEMERRFLSGLKSFADKRVAADVLPKDTAGLEEVADNGKRLYMRKGGTYADSRISNSTYYIYTGSNALKPVFSRQFPVQSIGNLIVLPAWSGVADVPMKIRFVCANRKVEELTTTVRQLVGYAVSKGCKPYYGVESNKDGRLVVSLFLYDAKSGYDHVLNVECKTADIATDKLVLTGRGYLYSPTTNVKRR